MKHGSTHLGKRGFTLIELLVVVAIISLLVSILVPSLQNAKALATQVVCQSNLHGIGQATYMYANDNNGMFPTILANASNSLPGVYPLMHEYHPFSFDSTMPYQPGPRWVCPVSIAEKNPYFPYGRPYCINSGLVYGRRSLHNPWWGLGDGNAVKNAIQISDVPNTATLPWMTEVTGNQWGGDFWYTNFSWIPFCFTETIPPHSWPTVTYNHLNDHVNIVFCDGHVEGLAKEDTLDTDLWILND